MTYAPPSGTLLDDIRRVYGSHVYPGAVGAPDRGG
jgi:hypothetical protein